MSNQKPHKGKLPQRLFNSSTMEERIKQAMYRTWDAIAPDAIEACEGKCTGEDAQEFVSDAGRMTMYGEDKEATLHFYRMNQDDQNRLLETVFPSNQRFD